MQSGLLQLLLGLDLVLSSVTGLHCCACLQLASLALQLHPAGPTPITASSAVCLPAKSLQTQGSPAPQLPHAQIKIRGEKVNLFLFADVTISCVKNHQDYTETLLELIKKTLKFQDIKSTYKK